MVVCSIFFLETLLFPLLFLAICYLLIVSWFTAAAQSALSSDFMHPSWPWWVVSWEKYPIALFLNFRYIPMCKCLPILSQVFSLWHTPASTGEEIISNHLVNINILVIWVHMGKCLTEGGFSSARNNRWERIIIWQILSNIENTSLRTSRNVTVQALGFYHSCCTFHCGEEGTPNQQTPKPTHLWDVWELDVRVNKLSAVFLQKDENWKLF